MNIDCEWKILLRWMNFTLNIEKEALKVSTIKRVSKHYWQNTDCILLYSLLYFLRQTLLVSGIFSTLGRFWFWCCSPSNQEGDWPMTGERILKLRFNFLSLFNFSTHFDIVPICIMYFFKSVIMPLPNGIWFYSILHSTPFEEMYLSSNDNNAFFMQWCL